MRQYWIRFFTYLAFIWGLFGIIGIAYGLVLLTTYAFETWGDFAGTAVLAVWVSVTVATLLALAYKE